MDIKLGRNRSDYKKKNRGLVLKMIATKQCTSRIEISKGTGLSKMTASSIVAELIRKDFLVENETEKNAELGRNPISLGISQNAPKVVGVLILRQRCEAVVCDMNLNIFKRAKAEITENTTADSLMQLVYQTIDEVMAGEDHIVAIGVASIGPISVSRGMILSPFYFYGIQNVEIVARLKERYQLPVFFDHDNQSAVLAEKLYGNGRKWKDILFVGIGRGVGCGIIADDELFCNQKGLSSEIGHVSIDYHGKLCQCGNRGCVETYISNPAILERLREVTGKQCTYKEFIQMTDNEHVDAVFTDMVEKLSMAIVNSINILNSEIVILGHSAAFWDKKYIAILEESINECKFCKSAGHIHVRQAHFLQDAQLLGSACNALNAIFKGVLPVYDEAPEDLTII